MLKVTILLMLLSSFTYAAKIDFVGPCSQKPLLSVEAPDKFETVGDLTIHYLNKNRVSYLGTERGINSMFNTPIGDEALEIVSDTQMRSYGWCFRVNGKFVDRYADEVYLMDGDHIEWIFSYAWYDREWKSMCNPAHIIKPKQICKN